MALFTDVTSDILRDLTSAMPSDAFVDAIVPFVKRSMDTVERGLSIEAQRSLDAAGRAINDANAQGVVIYLETLADASSARGDVDAAKEALRCRETCAIDAADRLVAVQDQLACAQNRRAIAVSDVQIHTDVEKSLRAAAQSLSARTDTADGSANTYSKMADEERGLLNAASEDISLADADIDRLAAEVQEVQEGIVAAQSDVQRAQQTLDEMRTRLDVRTLIDEHNAAERALECQRAENARTLAIKVETMHRKHADMLRVAVEELCGQHLFEETSVTNTDEQNARAVLGAAAGAEDADADAVLVDAVRANAEEDAGDAEGVEGVEGVEDAGDAGDAGDVEGERGAADADNDGEQVAAAAEDGQVDADAKEPEEVDAGEVVEEMVVAEDEQIQQEQQEQQEQVPDLDQPDRHALQQEAQCALRVLLEDIAAEEEQAALDVQEEARQIQGHQLQGHQDVDVEVCSSRVRATYVRHPPPGVPSK